MGRNPSRPLKDKIARKRASWLDMEIYACSYTWKSVFGYPKILMRPFGAAMIAAVLALNIFPPPSSIGYSACFFFLVILGGGLYTWFANYGSPKHGIPAFVTLLAVTIVSSNKSDPTVQAAVSNSNTSNSGSNWVSTLLVRSVLPLVLGIIGGPILKYLGNIEDERFD
jgi:hypothetical protein